MIKTSFILGFPVPYSYDKTKTLQLFRTLSSKNYYHCNLLETKTSKHKK